MASVNDMNDVTEWAEQELRAKLDELKTEMDSLNALIASTNEIIVDARKKQAELWDRMQLIKKTLRDQYGATDV